MREKLINRQKLVSDLIKHYEGSNRTFRTSTLTGLGMNQTFDLIRCMNVFMYFSGQTILENIRHAKSLLTDAGVFLCGTVPEAGTMARYLAYQKRGKALVPRWFGMDLGKLDGRDGTGWWGFHKDQPETLFLVKVLRLVSDNPDLFSRVSGAIDSLWHELGYSHRDPDGYLFQKGFMFSTADKERLYKAIADECGVEITAFLGGMGLCAHITPFGHLVIDLSQSHLEHYDQYFPVF